MTVSSAGRIYGHESVKYYDVVDGEYLLVEVLSQDIGPNDDILYVLEYLKGWEGVANLILKIDDLKNNHYRKFTKGLPPITHDTSWVMRVLDNKIVLCNGLGEIFILTFSDTQDQLNLECSFSLPSIDIPPEQLQNIKMQPYMCVTDKCEVFIARSHGKEVYICPITDEGQMEGMIRVPLKQHKKESEVFGVAFDVTHEKDIVVLRNTPHLESSFQIEVYSRNGNIWNVYPLPRYFITVDPCNTCLLSNPKGIVAVIQERQHMFDNYVNFCHLVGDVFLKKRGNFPKTESTEKNILW